MATTVLRDLGHGQELASNCPLVTKMQRFVRLSIDDVAVLESLCSDQATLPAHHVLVAEGRRQPNIYLILSGLAVRHKTLSSRSRQILGYLTPGDLSDPYCGDSETPSYEIMLLSECRIATIAAAALADVARRHPQIERGMMLAAMADMNILREWLLNIGQRSAYEKLSHFFCEMAIRLKSVDLANGDGSVDLPVSQSCIADTTGLTHIHVNRIVKRLRADGLVTLNKRLLTIPNPDRLAAIVGFERNYLDPPPTRD